MGGGLGLMLIMPLGGLIKNPNKGNPLGHDVVGQGRPAGPRRRHARSAPATRCPARWRPSSRPSRAATGSPTPRPCSSGCAPSSSRCTSPRKGQADFGYGDYVAYSKICTHAGCPVSLYEQETSRILCPCHQSQFHVTRGRQARSSARPPGRCRSCPSRSMMRDTSSHAVTSPRPSARRSGTSGARSDGHRHRARPRAGQPTSLAGKAAYEVDDRLIVAGPLRRTLNKVFPDHWSFLLGEIALYSFIVLLLSGTYLTFFFDASMREVVYDGVLRAAARRRRCRRPTTRR